MRLYWRPAARRNSLGSRPIACMRWISSFSPAAEMPAAAGWLVMPAVAGWRAPPAAAGRQYGLWFDQCARWHCLSQYLRVIPLTGRGDAAATTWIVRGCGDG